MSLRFQRVLHDFLECHYLSREFYQKMAESSLFQSAFRFSLSLRMSLRYLHLPALLKQSIKNPYKYGFFILILSSWDARMRIINPDEILTMAILHCTNSQEKCITDANDRHQQGIRAYSRATAITTIYLLGLSIGPHYLEELLKRLSYSVSILFGIIFCPQECPTRSIEIGSPSYLLSIREGDFRTWRGIGTCEICERMIYFCLFEKFC